MYTSYQIKKDVNSPNNENYHLSNNIIKDTLDKNPISDIYFHTKLNSLNINKLTKESFTNDEWTNYAYKEKLLTNDKNNMPL